MRSDEEPTLFGIALNRLVAFVGPYIAIGAGIIATWLTNHVHILATFHVAGNEIANAVAQALVFGLSALVVWLGQQKWLEGFQRWAYQTYTDISHVELPPSARPEPVVPAGATPEAAQGFGDAEPPASG
jgi:ABC-type uncharacterized transport system permease subunit